MLFGASPRLLRRMTSCKISRDVKVKDHHVVAQKLGAPVAQLGSGIAKSDALVSKDIEA